MHGSSTGRPSSKKEKKKEGGCRCQTRELKDEGISSFSSNKGGAGNSGPNLLTTSLLRPEIYNRLRLAHIPPKSYYYLLLIRPRCILSLLLCLSPTDCCLSFPSPARSCMSFINFKWGSVSSYYSIHWLLFWLLWLLVRCCL